MGMMVCLALLVLPGDVDAFTPVQSALFRPMITTTQHRHVWRYRSSLSDLEEYSEEEVLDMTELIRSLSLEPTDHDRRTRVKEVFHEALGRPNGSPQRFTTLFDKILIQYGEKVQNDAKKKYFEEEEKAAAAAAAAESSGEEKEETEPVSENTPEDEDVQPVIRVKTPEELQLWALVDMMVQTKTIVKKNNGELGSKGTFQ